MNVIVVFRIVSFANRVSLHSDCWYFLLGDLTAMRAPVLRNGIN